MGTTGNAVPSTSKIAALYTSPLARLLIIANARLLLKESAGTKYPLLGKLLLGSKTGRLMNKFVARFRKRNVGMLLGNSVPLGTSRSVDQSPNKFAEKCTTKRFVKIKLLKNVVKFQRSIVMMLPTGSATLRMLTNATVFQEPFVMMSQKL